jgi:hypothetical protein
MRELTAVMRTLLPLIEDEAMREAVTAQTRSILETSLYRAPELQGECWTTVSEILGTETFRFLERAGLVEAQMGDPSEWPDWLVRVRECFAGKEDASCSA